MHPIEATNPERVLARGEAFGFQWIITNNTYGHRCGYIKIEPDHPWYNKDYFDIDVKIHGGLTYKELEFGDNTPCWIGFDCAHFSDAPDPKLIRTTTPYLIGNKNGKVRSQEYVEEQCFELCKQAHGARKKMDNSYIVIFNAIHSYSVHKN